MKRRIHENLLKWKKSPSRKVMLVRGARQVGKTYSVRTLGKDFPHFIEINFEENRDVKTFFAGSLTPQRICEKLSAYSNIPIIPGKTLVFFDEVQACPNCFHSLRFFYEKMPDLHVLAAGSLLEFTISEIASFGVGRISSLFMYPMSFEEFISATESEQLAEMINNSHLRNPVDTVFHKRLLEHLRTYLTIGGMPEIVEYYRTNRDLRGSQKLIEELLMGFRDDFAKYRKKAPVIRIQETFQSIAFQTGGKFKYSAITPHGSHYESKNSLEMLVKAGLAYKIYHTSAQGVPLGAQINNRKFKVLLFDIGIHQRLLGLDLSQHMINNHSELINKGSTAELLVGLELISNSSPHIKPQLYYWHREARSSNAEIDYVVQCGETILPVEVKSGTRGAMQSMHLFLDKRNLETGVRISQENYRRYGKIVTIPLYTSGNLARGGNFQI